MDINTFRLKMLEKSLVMVTDQDIVFRRKHGKWALWNSETEEEKVFQDAESLLVYTVYLSPILPTKYSIMETRKGRWEI
ncbi:hypothetical protein [Acidaminococcus massiliensis]|jgi:CRISPR/Cas system CSM-associated protein Csm4 (group 5 of RAMP superfamily)|uniref:hypothetical protein n=1 Tax=Acidaminococcus massiliensis TaxID=1852375 RepID=UPI002051B37B|nr:hypothetical protein [Acidaminococcus massiliensis]DAJ46523.1 MAG TPA: hypothetical protein [Caudoviricetes sp.]